MKNHFLTFANTGYMKTDRLANQVKELNLFENIFQLNETHISGYLQRHCEFVKLNPPGYGLFIWKPKIIHDVLLSLPDGDILLYADAGVYININGKDRLFNYFEKSQTKDMVVFSANDSYKARSFVKNDAIMSYYPEFHNFPHRNKNACYAGLMMIKKTCQSLYLIKD